jgi:acyl-coenzyme A thioesterase PaaI-like protein
MSAPALFLPQSGEDGRTLLAPARPARSVWSLDLVHGAAMAALLARGVEGAVRPELRVARLTIDLMRPAPMQPLEARTTVVREGRRIQVVQSGLFTDRGGATVELARATALALRPSDLPTAGVIDVDAAQPPDPDSLPRRPANMVGGAEAYHSTVDWRPVGEWGASERPMLWIRNPADIVPGEPLSPLARAVATADALSPLANAEPSRRREGAVGFINADITLYLHRYPAGEWLCVAATSRHGGEGFVVSDGALYDRRGPLGRIALASLAQTQQPLGLAPPPGEGGR